MKYSFIYVLLLHFYYNVYGSFQKVPISFHPNGVQGAMNVPVYHIVISPTNDPRSKLYLKNKENLSKNSNAANINLLKILRSQSIYGLGQQEGVSDKAHYGNGKVFHGNNLQEKIINYPILGVNGQPGYNVQQDSTSNLLLGAIQNDGLGADPLRNGELEFSLIQREDLGLDSTHNGRLGVGSIPSEGIGVGSTKLGRSGVVSNQNEGLTINDNEGINRSEIGAFNPGENINHIQQNEKPLNGNENGQLLYVNTKDVQKHDHSDNENDHSHRQSIETNQGFEGRTDDVEQSLRYIVNDSYHTQCGNVRELIADAIKILHEVYNSLHKATNGVYVNIQQLRDLTLKSDKGISFHKQREVHLLNPAHSLMWKSISEQTKKNATLENEANQK